MALAYLYKWTHKPTLRWYVGCRTAKNCHPDDGYICSSKTVKPLIEQAPQDWERSILATGDVEQIRLLEAEVLTLADAMNDARSFNKHNQNGKFFCIGHSPETRAKISKTHPFAGRARPDHSQKMTGRKRKPEDVEKWRIKLLGVKKTPEHIAKLKVSKSKGLYETPAGTFASSRDAATANQCTKGSVLNKCHGYFSTTRGKWYAPVEGWRFIKKDES